MSISITDTHNSNAVAPLISVVLPVYNGEKYLADAIDSILLQTFVNFELIIIDDGSTDGSQHVLRGYERSDARVRLTVRENRGLATTLNDSLEIARGAWIARMDQDDIALPHRFVRQLQWLEQTGADICGTWVQRFGTSDKRIVRLRQTDEAIKMEMLFRSPLAHPTVMMRTALVQKLRYDRAWEKAEDYDLWERAAEAGLKMTNVPEVLLLYRIHSEQISSRTVIRQLQQAQEIRRRYWEFVFNSMQLNRMWIDETLKIFAPPLSDIDMNAVDASFAELLSHHHGESRSVIFENLIRLYLRVAVHCPNIISRFDKLNRAFGIGGGVTTKLMLWLVRLLQIDSESTLFKKLRKIYVWRASQ
jgi:glycosyltransferase involved in cell wall biosynthesis